VSVGTLVVTQGVDMSDFQLEFNITNDPEAEFKLACMQKQIDDMSVSVGKVRRRMFAELSEVKKLVSLLQIENESLKQMMKADKNEKIEWVYGEGGCLFDIRDYKISG
jgi:hypothetical protein